VEEGIEGLLPTAKFPQRIKHPSDVVREGDTVRLVVLSVDTAARKMSFSLKQAGPDPWKTVNEKYATDMVTTGTVTHGRFRRLRRRRAEGLVHIGELADRPVRQVTDVVRRVNRCRCGWSRSIGRRGGSRCRQTRDRCE
jgi:ribosomal protein S1